MSYSITEEDEKIAREQTQKKLRAVVSRELLPNGSYAPVPGIFDIAWKGLSELPAYDFLKSLRELDNDIIKSREQWALRCAPMLERGEFTFEQMKAFEIHAFKFTDLYPITIARNVFDNLKNREVRDLILRHSAEEMGHSELQADFMVDGLGMNRLEVWDAVQLGNSSGRAGFFGGDSSEVTELRKDFPELSYAIVPFIERVVPRSMRMIGNALRKQYGFKDSMLGFFDLHSYIDIYHERFGAYILSKYATDKRAQELFITALEERRKNEAESHMNAYYELKAK